MRVEIRAPDDTLIRVAEAEPRCGEDFCDRCTDCLHCYADECCPQGCRWILYTDVHAERIAEIDAEAKA